MNLRSALPCAFILIWLAAIVPAQTFPFRLVVTQGSNAVVVPNGATVTFAGTLGQAASAQVTATYGGTGQVTITGSPSTFGSTDFTATLKGSLPINLTPGGSVTFTIQFLASGTTQSSAQFSLPFSETVSSTTSNSGPTTTTGAIGLTLQGTAPSFVLSYILQTDQNVVALPPGGTIPFPATPINTTAQAALSVNNTGSGPGVIAGITISGKAFKLSGTPLFPDTVAAGASLQVQVIYQPTAVGTDTGQIQITFSGGSVVTVNLQGIGSSPGFTYQVLTSPPVTVAPGGTVSFPDTNIGQTSSLIIRILNAGNASGTVNSISVAGQGFQLSSPTALPQTLAPNASLTLTISFTPTQPGTLAGALFVNSDTLLLSGVGLGSQLTYSYVTAGTTITLGSGNNSVFYSPVMISQSEQLIFDVKNTGTLAATISNIGIGQTNSPFSISTIPLPLKLAPGADFHFTITFAPTAVGFANGTLQLDAATVALVGSGTQPSPLPAYSITGASGTVSPQSQPSIALTLASTYPVALSGTLTMSVTGNLPPDPAVQFATGGLTVPFVIPANATSAVFGKQGTQIGLQTGTVAGTITLTPSFETQAGSVDLTPATPTTLQLTVAPATPVLVALQITGQTANSFVINVTGFTTTRTLTAWNVQLTPATGFSLPTSQFTIDVQQISTVWYKSTASQVFGGQFELAIPFTFQGTVGTNQTLLNSIASVAVTMKNEVGTSNSIQVGIQ